MGIHMMPPLYEKVIKPQTELFEYCNTDWDSGLACYGAYWLAQTFTPQIAHTIKKLKLRLQRVGVIGTITASIRATEWSDVYNDYIPSGGDLCSGSIDGADVAWYLDYPTGDWIWIPLGAGVSPDVDVVYAIVLRALDAEGEALNWISKAAHSIYPRGRAWASADSGETWLQDWNAYDFMFEEWGFKI